MILFFDRSVGTTIPEVVKRLRAPVEVQYHQDHFAQEAPDDEWLPLVTKWGWFVVGYDYHYHTKSNELYAIRQHGAGCFYLWGAEANMWDRMRVFARGFDNIVQAAQVTERPFVYTVQKHGALTDVWLPSQNAEARE